MGTRANSKMHGSKRQCKQLNWAMVVLASMVILAACASPEQSASFNAADVDFLQDMISDHEQAIAVAELIPERTERAELRAYQPTIIQGRSRELDTIRSLLADAGWTATIPRLTKAAEPVDESELKALADRRGDDFDHEFLDLMMSHTLASVEASEQAIEDGQNPAVAELAASIIDQRQTELARMQSWGHQWHLLESVPPDGMGPGDQGPQVLALEQRLDALRFDVGEVDDLYDTATAHAVTAFQKLVGAHRDGRAGPQVIDHLDSAQLPPPLVPGGGPERVEIDLTRQLLFLYQDDQLFKILPVSTGSGERFCDEGNCRLAVTPPGTFEVTRRISGWRNSDLGRLYNPLYFNGGIAIHGYPTVPIQPASHGCVRIPMSSAIWFPDEVPNGTPVYVLDATTPPTPTPSQQ
jgi:uncharacterized protein (DUF305 family)/peptidoglycan hydrolase-like protein with peptidoglycan-binding domain